MGTSEVVNPNLHNNSAKSFVLLRRTIIYIAVVSIYFITNFLNFYYPPKG
jgi:hypothetical protein